MSAWRNISWDTDTCIMQSKTDVVVCDILQIRDLVSDRTIGQMRIQFWRDSIDKIFMVNFFVIIYLKLPYLITPLYSNVLKAKKQNKTRHNFYIIIAQYN